MLAQSPPQPSTFQQPLTLQQPFASQTAPGLQQPSVGLLSLDQLDNLTAPIALYPDPLLAQVLAASTYPLEIVEAQQWLSQNGNLRGGQLLEAARQQSWDASVQALVAFPDVLALLNRDIRWTTDLGNAFLAQQADVMNEVQQLRARAQDNGRLASTPQQSVSTAEQNGQSAIEIQPANPQVIYVPTYNPAYVWGPPAVGAYPPLGYAGPGYGFSFNPGVFIGALFSGLLSFGGWGWGLSWLAHALFLNNLFLGHFGFGGSGGGGHGNGFGGGVAAHTVWAHNPGHRLGVPYPNRSVESRFAAGRSNAGFENNRSYSARSYGGGSYNAGSYRESASREGFGGSRAAAPREQASAGFQRFGGASGERGYQSYDGASGRAYDRGQSYNRNDSYNRGPSYNRNDSYNRAPETSRGVQSQSRYQSPAQPYRSNEAYRSGASQRGTEAFASNYRGAPSSARAPAASHYSSPRYSAPKMPSQHFSKPSGSSHFHSNSHSGGHSGHSSGGHSGKHK
jgi:hypothetical protein